VTESSAPTGASTPSVVVYPGSFDPITNGHVDIVERAARIFGRVIVAVGEHAEKRGFFPVEQRCELIAASVAHVEGVSVTRFEGLVVNFCRQHNARVLLRGLRAVSDFEQEFQMGLANRDLAPGVETLFLIPDPARMFVSSSLVREIASHGGDFERYVPAPVAAAMRRHMGKV
jgi:pantetheine-phosphate adenylyltransferase